MYVLSYQSEKHIITCSEKNPQLLALKKKKMTCSEKNHLLLGIVPPPRYPSGIVLASSAGGHGFNPQSRTASYQRRYKNETSCALV